MPDTYYSLFYVFRRYLCYLSNKIIFDMIFGGYVSGTMLYGMIPLIVGLLSTCMFSNVLPRRTISEPVINSINTFSMELFQRVLQSKPGNVAVSPIGVATVLALLGQGSRNESRVQLEKVLNINLRVAKSALGALTRRLKFIGKEVSDSQPYVKIIDPVIWAFGNKMFFPSGFNIKPHFRLVAQKDFITEIDQINFHLPNDAVKQINTWVDGITHDKTTNPFNKEYMLPENQLLIGNVIFFKGTWLKLKNDIQQKGMFIPAFQQSVSVTLLYWKEALKAGSNQELGAKWVHLPFHGSQFSLVIVLPDNKYGLQNLLENITLEYLHEFLNSDNVMDVDIELPEFKINTFHSMKPFLQELGVSDIFTSKSILNGINAKQSLKISDIFHRMDIQIGSIETNEGKNSTHQGNQTSEHSGKMHLKVDHPFLAIITDKNTSLPLLLARVTDPSKTY